jgi:hypothetical protein
VQLPGNAAAALAQAAAGAGVALPEAVVLAGVAIAAASAPSRSVPTAPLSVAVAEARPAKRRRPAAARALEQSDSLDAVAREGHLVPGPLKDAAQAVAVGRFVIDDEYADFLLGFLDIS